MDEFYYGKKKTCGWENHMGSPKESYERKWSGEITSFHLFQVKVIFVLRCRNVNCMSSQVFTGKELITNKQVIRHHDHGMIYVISLKQNLVISLLC